MTEPFVVPATYAQERVWFASQIATGVPLYHLFDELALPYQVSYAQLRDALLVVCNRQEALRTSFRIDDGALMQVVHPSIEPRIEHVDLRGLPDAQARDRLAALTAQYAHAQLPTGRPATATSGGNTRPLRSSRSRRPRTGASTVSMSTEYPAASARRTSSSLTARSRWKYSWNQRATPVPAISSSVQVATVEATIVTSASLAPRPIANSPSGCANRWNAVGATRIGDVMACPQRTQGRVDAGDVHRDPWPHGPPVVRAPVLVERPFVPGAAGEECRTPSAAAVPARGPRTRRG